MRAGAYQRYPGRSASRPRRSLNASDRTGTWASRLRRLACVTEERTRHIGTGECFAFAGCWIAMTRSSANGQRASVVIVPRGVEGPGRRGDGPDPSRHSARVMPSAEASTFANSPPVNWTTYPNRTSAGCWRSCGRSKEAHADATVPALAAESALAKDCFTPGEDAAWASL